MGSPTQVIATHDVAAPSRLRPEAGGSRAERPRVGRTQHATDQHGTARNRGPITVALVNDYEIILRGLHSILSPFSDRIAVVDHDTDDHPEARADVALFDTFATRRDALDRARALLADGMVDHVVLYTFDASEEFLKRARAVGVSGVVLKSVGGEALAEALERVVAGELVGLDLVARAARSAPSPSQLSSREEEVLALLASGRTNAEIAEELFLSVDTVKTYVRRVFTKLGVKNRTQAAMHAARRSLVPGHATGPTDHTAASVPNADPVERRE
jgi:DNA-binding NarL/FixJ family response regulator